MQRIRARGLMLEMKSLGTEPVRRVAAWETRLLFI